MKTDLLIEIKDGMVSNISSTNANVNIRIIDHDNFTNDVKHAIDELNNEYEPDSIITINEMENIINETKKKYID